MEHRKRIQEKPAAETRIASLPTGSLLFIWHRRDMSPRAQDRLRFAGRIFGWSLTIGVALTLYGFSWLLVI